MASIPYDKFPVLPSIDSLSITSAASRVSAERDSLFQTHLRQDDVTPPPPANDSRPQSESKPSAPPTETAGSARPSDNNDRNESAEANSENREEDTKTAGAETSDARGEAVKKDEKSSDEQSEEQSSANADVVQSAPVVANVDAELTSLVVTESPEGEAVTESSKGEDGKSSERKTNANQPLRQRLDTAPAQKDDHSQLVENRAAAEIAASQTSEGAEQAAAAHVPAEAKSQDEGKEQTSGDGKVKVRVEAAQATDATTRKAESVASASSADTSGESASPDTASPRDNPSNQASSPTPSGGSSETAAAPLSRLPQHLIGRGGERTAESPHLNEADQARFVQRVARAFQAAQNRDGEIRLRLSPPELGSLRLELKVQGGALTARIEAETTAARQLLLDNLPVLRERLAEQGVRVEQFDVDLTDRQPGGLPDGPANEQHRDSQSGASPAHARGESDKTEKVTDQPVARRAQHDGRLNVVV